MATQYFENVAKHERHAFGDPSTAIIRKLSLSDLSDALRGLGGFQGHTKSRNYPVRDLSRSRACSVQTGA